MTRANISSGIESFCNKNFKDLGIEEQKFACNQVSDSKRETETFRELLPLFINGLDTSLDTRDSTKKPSATVSWETCFVIVLGGMCGLKNKNSSGEKISIVKT